MPQQPQVQQPIKDEPVSPEVTIGSIANVLYDFEAENSEELSVKVNEFVIVIEDPEDGWLKVKRGTDSGYVPSSYIQVTYVCNCVINYIAK